MGQTTINLKSQEWSSLAGCSAFKAHWFGKSLPRLCGTALPSGSPPESLQSVNGPILWNLGRGRHTPPWLLHYAHPWRWCPEEAVKVFCLCTWEGRPPGLHCTGAYRNHSWDSRGVVPEGEWSCDVRWHLVKCEQCARMGPRSHSSFEISLPCKSLHSGPLTQVAALIISELPSGSFFHWLTHTDFLIKWSLGHTLSVPTFPNMDRLKIFQIFTFCFLFLNYSVFKSFFPCILLWAVRRSQAQTFNTLLRNSFN